jgi:hypothetical protein
LQPFLTRSTKVVPIPGIVIAILMLLLHIAVSVAAGVPAIVHFLLEVAVTS